MFTTRSLAVLAVCIGRAISATDFSLYGYGTNITGLRLFYGDGYAYLGDHAPSFISQSANLTFSQTQENTEFLGTPDNTTSLSAQPTMFIESNTDGLKPIGFVLGSTVNSSISVTGFGLYGGWAFHKNNDTGVQMKFYATSTNESGIYQVQWYGGSAQATNGVPIALRTVAPVVMSS